MRYYLDTNILIFAIIGKGIDHQTEDILSDYSNLLYTSSVCVMELMQILQTRPMKGEKHNPQKVFDYLDEMGVEVKYVEKRHLEMFSQVPILHNDPNDRLIIAQATTDKMPLISSDIQFPQYEKKLKSFKTLLNKRK